MRTKLKSLSTGRVVERTFKGTERIPQAEVEYRNMQYVYREGEDFVFMDLGTYEQSTIPHDVLGDAPNYLKEGDEVSSLWWNGKPIGVDIPAKVELKIVETMPGVKGDTVTQATKPAVLETGYEVQVPLFINSGEVIRVDTRTGKYVERA